MAASRTWGLIALAALVLAGCRSLDVAVERDLTRSYPPQGPARLFEGPAPPGCAELARIEVRDGPFYRATGAELRASLARAAGQLGADRARVESAGTERRTGFLLVRASRYDAHVLVGTAWRCPPG